ncbi:MAG: hypothetical protein U0414_31190 [Polyangiaceae bacterium]
MNRFVAAAALVFATALGLGACKENPVATEACKEQPKMTYQCRDCCHASGATGWSFFGDKCVCRS